MAMERVKQAPEKIVQVVRMIVGEVWDVALSQMIAPNQDRARHANSFPA